MENRQSWLEKNLAGSTATKCLLSERERRVSKQLGVVEHFRVVALTLDCELFFLKSIIIQCQAKNKYSWLSWLNKAINYALNKAIGEKSLNQRQNYRKLAALSLFISLFTLFGSPH